MDRSSKGQGEVAAIWWIRRDLRLEDNGTLLAALEHARTRKGRIAAVFVLDSKILSRLDREDRRVTVIAQGLADLDRRLREIGGGIHLLPGEAATEIVKFALAHGAPPVFAGGDFEPYGLSRDLEVRSALESGGSFLEIRHDHMVIPPGSVRKRDGSEYRVFTPFSKGWLSWLHSQVDPLPPRPSLPAAADVAPGPTALTAESIRSLAGFAAPATPGPPGGRIAAQARLSRFLPSIDDYGSTRDFPSAEGTSRLSMDLRFGFLSARELAKAALEKGSVGANKWLLEICWRDFYQEILRLHPRTVEKPFQERLAQVVWDEPETDPLAAARWLAWTEGRTGYPFVDAAMRELAATGWMHNRARMVVASFLTKDLHIHWKRGERWFARHLLDIELASNVGGWQWSAGTGTDAQPWFRIFHPVEQGKRWDPDGRWIRQWCPELSHLPDRWIHAPWTAPPTILAKAGIHLGKSWPSPLVDHALERTEALERFARVARSR